VSIGCSIIRGVVEATQRRNALMPALPPYIIEPIWQQLSALLPRTQAHHPLGCHRPRIPERVVFEKLVQILVFGCAYWRIADESCSDTTLRRRRDEWILAGVMERLRKMALAAYEQIIGLELSDVGPWTAASPRPLAAARRRARAQWIGGNGASNARRRWTLAASLWALSQPRPTATTHHS
jgi:transposase